MKICQNCQNYYEDNFCSFSAPRCFKYGSLLNFNLEYKANRCPDYENQQKDNTTDYELFHEFLKSIDKE